jgi:acyl-coenzyme A synthetase/AMP-(fatty) acid ligase
MIIEHIAYACLTKHCEEGRQNKEIIYWIQNDLSETRFTYRDFEIESNKIAKVLTNLEVFSNEVVGIFLPRSPIFNQQFFWNIKMPGDVVYIVFYSWRGSLARQAWKQ